MGGGGETKLARAAGGRAATTLALVFLLGALIAGCGSSARSSSAGSVAAGQLGRQVDLRVPDGWTKRGDGYIRTGAPPATGPASGAAGAAAAPGDTVPLAKEDPTTAFFRSLGVFQSCLSGLGVKFIGVPDGSNPNSPANNPDYIKALSTCAAKSNIVQALKDEQTAQDNLTPAEIETQNKNFLKWRDCMIGRGWGIPEPKPDAKGRLFSFGAGGGGSVPQFTPPPGKDILTSGDTTGCATEVQQELAASGGGGG